MTDPARPTVAGMYDHYLGGTQSSPVDRAAAEQILQVLPSIKDAAWANRGFLQRAVRRMVSDWGIRQFIDVGAGLPTQRNTHDVITEVVPDGRVVYVDIDPMVVARGNELVADLPHTTVIQGDVRQPALILGHPETRRLVDFTVPVGLLLVAVLHFVSDEDDPWRIVSRFLAGVPSGSYLALSHGSGDHAPTQLREAVERVYASTSIPLADRTKTEIARFFDGLEIVPPYPGASPGVTFVGLWGAESPAEADTDGSRLSYAAVARKP